MTIDITQIRYKTEVLTSKRHDNVMARAHSAITIIVITDMHTPFTLGSEIDFVPEYDCYNVMLQKSL